MASILKFAQRVRPAAGRTGREGEMAGPCQIIIFPGVRYERWGDAGGGKPAPRAKRRRRRRRAD